MASSDSKIEAIQKQFQVLSGVASSLNTASDELTRAVAALDEALKKLNVGLTAWVTFSKIVEEEYPEIYDSQQIGYCKVNGTWGIALRHISGDAESGEQDEDGPWLFSDASREMRIQAVDKIPELIEALSKEASETTRKIQEKTKQVTDLADAIRQDTNKIVANGLSPGQIKAIIAAVSAQQKFIGEIVHYAHRWDWDGGTLRIYFSAQKRSFGEMLQSRDALLKVQNAVQGILGPEAKIGVQIEQQLAPTPPGKANKVQK
jgi:prefoldin subunit 5